MATAFFDFACGHCRHFNRAPHEVVQAIQQQAEKFIHISSDLYHENWIALGEKFSEIAPWHESTSSFMTNSGTESVEAAIKLARYSTGRSQFIGFRGFSRPHHWRSHIYCQQSQLQRRFLSPNERRPACTIPLRIPAIIRKNSWERLRRDCGALHRRGNPWPPCPW